MRHRLCEAIRGTLARLGAIEQTEEHLLGVFGGWGGRRGAWTRTWLEAGRSHGSGRRRTGPPEQIGDQVRRGNIPSVRRGGTVGNGAIGLGRSLRSLRSLRSGLIELEQIQQIGRTIRVLRLSLSLSLGLSMSLGLSLLVQLRLG